MSGRHLPRVGVPKLRQWHCASIAATIIFLEPLVVLFENPLK
jgi:hypothetical protein